MQTLTDCLESVRRRADRNAALEQYPHSRAQPAAYLDVISLIRPLAEDVEPSPSWRETIRARLLDLREGPTPSAFDTGGARSEAYQRRGGAEMRPISLRAPSEARLEGPVH